MGKLRRFPRKVAVRFYLWLQRLLTPQTDYKRENRYLKDKLDEQAIMLQAFESGVRADAHERVLELVEARRMAGTGPWRVSDAAVEATDKLVTATVEAMRQPEGQTLQYFHDSAVDLRETGNPLLAQGAYGDIELALQNVEWRREVNLSWLEFSRWGIQQIILICRLHYIKNPTIQRGINVAAQYVFGRGVEVSSPDDDANDVLKEFFERNKKVLGQASLTELERQTYYDGNLFFGFFTDKTDSGKVTVRMFDATEIMDVITDPNDTNTPWFYRREWTQRNFNIVNGQVTTDQKAAWYPALGYDPPAGEERPPQIGERPVIWDVPIYHRKVGSIVNWHFGCPLAYAALDWARASKRFLEACATVKQALAQISMVFTTKGGQAALAAGKSQLSTNVGPETALWDSNPPPVNASIFGGGPGTSLQAFKTTGAGGDPEEVRRFELMVWRTFGLPETFGGDVKTGNLATAQSLDRPTELNFLEKQERWREDLMVIGRFVLEASNGAANGNLREARLKRFRVEAIAGKRLLIMEAPRTSIPGQTVKYKPGKPTAEKIELMVTFPSIREGDIPELVAAVVEGMTLNNTQGQVVGIDEKAGVRKLYEICDIADGDELIDQQYPDTGPDKYDPVRKDEPPPAPTPTPTPGAPAPEPEPKPPAAPKAKAEEAFRRLRRSIDRIRERRRAA